MSTKRPIHYLVHIDRPENHIVKVRITMQRSASEKSLAFFLPSWSPGSYLMREYGRHVRHIRAWQENGEPLAVVQQDKGCWEVHWDVMPPRKEGSTFELEYEVYCHELTVRTSHMDASHAFLHGPSYLMGLAENDLAPTIEFRFPDDWSKLTTSLEDISPQRQVFRYRADGYDDLIDRPVEIGCHETDGFMFQGLPHELAFYGETYPHNENLKQDVEKIVATVAATVGGDLPYAKYTFITHFIPNLYGGLEHRDSCALQFDGRKLKNRKDYLNWLSLVAHEYFHLWNVKRIRPRELGPFDYRRENYTSMLWLVEGLTSFMDELFVYRSGLSTLEEYLELVRSGMERFLQTPGRRFHSLEQSSFNAWIKLYRADENTLNSTVSYYNKGALAFFVLNTLLGQKGKSIDALIHKLREQYEKRPEEGMAPHEVFALVEEVGGEDTRHTFESLVQTTEDIDLESSFKAMGLEIEWEQKTPYLGLQWDLRGERVFLKSVLLDGPAQSGGLNAGDEILAVNGQRFLAADTQQEAALFQEGESYRFVVSRLGQLVHVDVTPGQSPRRPTAIKIVERDKAEKFFLP